LVAEEAPEAFEEVEPRAREEGLLAAIAPRYPAFWGEQGSETQAAGCGQNPSPKTHPRMPFKYGDTAPPSIVQSHPVKTERCPIPELPILCARPWMRVTRPLDSVFTMSEWNYTQCAKPFASVDDARQYLHAKDFAGWILQREEGFSAVCPAYPEGYYPDATVIEEVNNSRDEMGTEKKRDSSLQCC
jgi:hypothetical protein